MQAARRRWLLHGVALGASAAAPALARAQVAPTEVVLATPGPGSAVSLIPELAVKIGADKAEGLALRLKFVNGGGVAIRELNNGNAHCAVFGLPAAMHENLAGPKLVALAAVEDRTPLSVMVRSDLKGVVRKVEDLHGRVLGVHSNTLTTLTTGQQFLLLVLRAHGVAEDAVRFVAAGQSWDTQSAALRGRLVDAIVSEEPFGLRLEQAGLAFPLLRSGHPGDSQRLPGMGFLRGTLLSTRRLVEQQPELAQRLVAMVQRTLAWRLAHTPEAVVTALGLAGADAAAIGALLATYPQLYSGDGRFSAAQLAQTEVFFRASAGQSAETQAYQLASMVLDRWAGRKP
jgi:ABC-type nitrate/sulfonate/bicarbonate transport system substrate-binding protein